MHVKTAVKNTLLAYPEARLTENSYEDDAGKIAKQTIVIQGHVRKMSTGAEAETAYDKCLQETKPYPALHANIMNMQRICTQAWGGHSSRQTSQTDDLMSVWEGMGISSDDSSETDDIEKLFGQTDAEDQEEDEEEDEEDHGSVKCRTGDKAKAKAKSKAKSKAKAAPKKKPAACIDSNPKIDIGSVKLEGPYPNGKCYIRHKPDGTKLQCLVNLDSTKCANNGEIMKKVMDHIRKNPGLRKSDAVVERDSLISKIGR